MDSELTTVIEILIGLRWGEMGAGVRVLEYIFFGRSQDRCNVITGERGFLKCWLHSAWQYKIILFAVDRIRQ